MKKVISLVAVMLAVMMLFAACAPTATTGTTGGTEPTGTTAGTTTGTTAGTTTAGNTTTGTQGTTGGTVTPGNTGNDPVCPDNKESLKILAIGNSFSVDAMEHLADILKGEGYEEIVLGNLYIGGCSLATHKDNIESKASVYDFYTNKGEGWSSKKGSIFEGLSYDEWDVITIQQVSGFSGVPESYIYLQDIVDYVKAEALNPDAKILWHMTWAYEGDSTHNDFKKYNNNQMTMYNAIVDTVKSKIIANNTIDGYIPSGTAIQNLRTSYFGDELTRDGYHLSYDIGRYTAALMWYKQITGADITDLTAIPSKYPNIMEHLPAIKEAVNNAFAKNLEVTNATITEYVDDLVVMTDADKAYLTKLGLDPAKYEVLNLDLSFSAYYLSTNKTAALVTTAGNSPKFLATRLFTPQTLPVGAVVNIEEGYQYRLEGWQKTGTPNSEARLDNSTAGMVINEALYTKYNFLGFNVSKVSGEDIVYNDRTALRIYVPVKEETADLTLTEDDKAFLTSKGLTPDNYTKVDLGYTLFSYYNSTSGTTSNLLSAENNTSNNLVNFISTRVIPKSEVPVGSVIRVDSGYQYRPERFVNLGAKPAKRGDNTTTNYVVVDDAWWGTHNYVGFNVAIQGAAADAIVSMETGTHFVIYVPKAN